MITKLTAAEASQKRIVTMRKGVVSAAKAIDDKFIAMHGEAVLRSDGKGYLPHSPYRTALVTLTYKPGIAWEPSHIRVLVDHYRKWFRRNGHVFHYVWTVEMQGNGNPHYHMVMWVPRGLKPPFPDAQGWWPWGMSNAVWARSPVGYIAKYASKESTKSDAHLPKGCRLWGYGGLKLDERSPVLYALAPRWLKFLIPEWSMPRRRVVDLVSLGMAKPSKKVRKITATAWVLTCAGLLSGYTYFGPYDFEGFDIETKSLAIRHRGVIELVASDGQHFAFSHDRNH